MSFGFGVGDFLAVSKLALKVYNVYKDAPSEFRSISDEAKSLHIIVEEHEGKFRNTNLRSEDQQRLGEILQGCSNVLRDLDELMSEYKSLGVPQGSRVRDRLKWDSGHVTTLRARLTSNTTMLNTFVTRYAGDPPPLPQSSTIYPQEKFGIF